ncbi:MAG: response regulator transcription factor [Desulfovibrionaceae bacterium]|nr:response regulator transcription factor [Desulfovibrionaceae bacterium]
MKILIVDDHAVVRRGTIEIVSDFSDQVEFDEAGSSAEALDKVAAGGHDLVLLDISLPDESGLETLKKIRAARPGLPVLILSMHPEEEYAVRTFKVGADGYLAKGSAPDELVNAIRKVLSGGKYVSAALSDRLVSELVEPKRTKRPQELLSHREYEVLAMLAKGNKLTAIAEDMGLSVKTASTYKTRGMRKLGLTNNAELVRYAMAQGMLKD